MTARPRSCCSLRMQIQDLRLGGDVEGGGRLVGDQDARLAGERHRDHHPLAQAARELERVAVDAPLRLRDADHAQQLDRRARAPPASRASLCRRIASIIWLPIVWKALKRAHRLLEDVARSRRRGWRASPGPRPSSSARSTTPAVGAPQQDLAGLDPARALDDPQDRARGDALAAAATRRRCRACGRARGRSETPSTARTMPSSWWNQVRRSRTREDRLSHRDRPRRAGRRRGN